MLIGIVFGVLGVFAIGFGVYYIYDGKNVKKAKPIIDFDKIKGDIPEDNNEEDILRDNDELADIEVTGRYGKRI